MANDQNHEVPRTVTSRSCRARARIGLGRRAAWRASGLAGAVLVLVGATAVPAAAQGVPTTGAPASATSGEVAPPAGSSPAGSADPAAAGDGGTTVAPITAASTTVAPTTSRPPATCDAVAPVDAVFVGTVVATGPDSVKFHVDEVRTGDPGAADVQVIYVRDARFLKDGRSYLVTASEDTDLKLLVSKVRPRRGEDPRCTVKDPIYTREADGSAIDTGIFTGLHGHSRDVLLAFVEPLGAVLAVLASLVIVKYVLIFGFRGVRRLVRRAA